EGNVVFTSKRPGRSISKIALLLCLAIVVQIAAVTPALANDVQPVVQVEAEAAILIEAETGQVLYAMNKDELLPPASMAKMMSEYVILNEIKAGNIGWND